MKRYQSGVVSSVTLALLVIFGSVLGHSTFAKGRDWQPQRTWVFAVGILQFQHKDLFDSFPQKNRRDAQLIEFFRQQGVPESQIVFLKDSQATTRHVENSFPAFLSKAGPNDLLFFYYTGHGYKSDDEQTTYFATYDDSEDTVGWATDSIIRDIEKYFKGSRALLTADTCFSGTLAQQTRQLGRRVSYATLASATSNHTSTENWTFTEMLLAGLRGKSFADLNNDGEVTLSELAEDIKQDMAFAEDQRSVFITTGDFQPGMDLAAADRKVDPLISSRFEVRSEGDWYKAKVIDARNGTYRVHFFGYEDSDDEWVTQKEFRAPKIAANNPKTRNDNSDWKPRHDSVSKSSPENAPSNEYRVGASVEVNWKGKWYSGKILAAKEGRHLVHYAGYDDSWDEWVPDNRIRRPTWNN
ncbi:MAG TPA: Tudor-knot domain-containing protein [Pyrinomonadaceae bacterium]|nr:Tudor-knot domain-containing protein [Pyrinomonadaceae bacterium]